MKINVLVQVALCAGLLSNCSLQDHRIPDLDETVPPGSSPVLSSCSIADNILFDTPVNNTIQPVDLSQNGMSGWKLVEELSDEFNYAGGKSAPAFGQKWNLGYVNAYTGPIPTIWSGDRVSFEDIDATNRCLVLSADSVGAGDNRRLICGMLSSKSSSSYPLYQETRVKISRAQLANAVWMISDGGEVEEIDNLEAYGPRLRPDGTSVSYPYYADRIHLSHHTFKTINGVREDYQPQARTWMSRKKDLSSCNRTNDVSWSEEYHIFGVRWSSPTRLDYYIDGKRVKTTSGLRDQDGIDPKQYTTCDGLVRNMTMLISQAAQTWRYGAGAAGVQNFWNSRDVKTGPNTKMLVDWIRVYTPTGTVNRRTCP